MPRVYADKCLIEPLTLDQLSYICNKCCKVVWNNRDLNTGERKTNVFEEARKIFSGWLCQASFIKSMDDVNKKADAILVGSHLKQFCEKLKHYENNKNN